MTTGKNLSRREFDAVIRRAAELASIEAEGGEAALTEEEVLRIAGEVGLGEAHVRRALAEVRTGVQAGGTIDRVFGPSQVRASRAVPGSPSEVSAKIDEYLVATELLQAVRRGPTFLQYRPADDWASQLARGGMGRKKYSVASAGSVEVQLAPEGPSSTTVSFLLDPGVRAEHVAGAVFGGGVGGVVAGGLAGFALSTFAPLGLAVAAGGVVAATLWSGIAAATRHAYRKRLVEVQNDMEGILDALENGASLEPPPPAWRRWVKRHFKGVVRDLDLGAGPRDSR